MATYILKRKTFSDDSSKDNTGKWLTAAAITAGTLYGRRVGMFGNKAMMTSNARWANIGKQTGWKGLQTSSLNNINTAGQRMALKQGATEAQATKIGNNFQKTATKQLNSAEGINVGGMKDFRKDQKNLLKDKLNTQNNKPAPTNNTTNQTPKPITNNNTGSQTQNLNATSTNQTTPPKPPVNTADALNDSRFGYYGG